MKESRIQNIQLSEKKQKKNCRRRQTWEDKTKHRKGKKETKKETERGGGTGGGYCRVKDEQTDAGELNVSFTQCKVRPSR